MKRPLLITLLSLLILPAIAQMSSREFTTQFLEANRLMEEKYWSKSIDAWIGVLQIDPSNANVNYKLGYCYMQTANDKKAALPYLEVATSERVAKKYDPFDPKESKAPVEAFYYLGKSQHLDYQLDKAIESFSTFQSKVSKKHYMHRLAERQIEMCNNAKYQISHDQNYLISNVGPVINEETNDYSPVISLDESSMFFTSRRLRNDSTNEDVIDTETGEFYEDIYVSYKDKTGAWMEPELLNINTDGHAATISTSPDGQTLYIYYDEKGDGQIWKSVLFGETWSEPEMMGSDINSDAWETHITVSADEQTLYYVSNREGGFGGRDIYRCVKLPTGEWSKSLNVGAALNTEWEEDSPFLSADGKTLYFASQGHNSMGGFDIFYSTLGDDGEWSKPVNIGYPLNTVEDDLFFAPAANSKRAYYSSQKEGGYGLKDIYVVDMPDSPVEADLAVLKGFIYPAQGEELPDDIFVMVTNKQTGDVTEYRPRQRDGAYITILNPCDSYQIDYVVNKEIYQQEFINVPCDGSYSEINKEIFLLPVNLAGDEEGTVVEVPEPKEESEPIIEPGARGTNDYLGTGVTVGSAFIDGEAYFQRYFVYDFDAFAEEETEFSDFINNLVKLIEANGDATVIIESSASRVPSSKYKNNQELTANRNKTAEKQVVAAMNKRGFKKGKDYQFGTPRKLVGGPKYRNDAQTNKATYELYQYIKVWAY